jgi:hypothetical protein
MLFSNYLTVSSRRDVLWVEKTGTITSRSIGTLCVFYNVRISPTAQNVPTERQVSGTFLDYPPDVPTGLWKPRYFFSGCLLPHTVATPHTDLACTSFASRSHLVRGIANKSRLRVNKPRTNPEQIMDNVGTRSGPDIGHLKEKPGRCVETRVRALEFLPRILTNCTN